MIYAVLALSSFMLCRGFQNPVVLEDYFDNLGFTIAGGRYLANYALRDERAKSGAADAILRFLRNQRGAPGTEFDRVHNLQPPLQARDFWALVLAELTSQRLVLQVTDTPLQRKRKIERLLHDLPAKKR